MIYISRYSKLVGCSIRTAYSDLQKMLEKGLVREANMSDIRLFESHVQSGETYWFR